MESVGTPPDAPGQLHIQRNILGFGNNRADMLRGGHHRLSVLTLPQRGAHFAQHVSGEAIRQDRLQAIAHFQAAPAVANHQQQQDPLVFSFLPDAPCAVDGVGHVLNGLSLEGRERHQSHLRACQLFDSCAIAFERAPAGAIDDMRKIADVAFRFERLPIDCPSHAQARQPQRRQPS